MNLNYILMNSLIFIGFENDFDVDDANTTAWGDGWEESDEWAASDVNVILFVIIFILKGHIIRNQILFIILFLFFCKDTDTCLMEPRLTSTYNFYFVLIYSSFKRLVLLEIYYQLIEF